jgi:hypothetical protein
MTNFIEVTYMLYCEKCRKLCDDGLSRCPECRSKKLREPKVGDAIYLITKEPIWAGALEELLNKNNIPFLKEGTMGEGMDTFVGYGLETYSFYVPYQAYEAAKQLCEAIFTEVTDEDVFLEGDDGSEESDSEEDK